MAEVVKFSLMVLKDQGLILSVIVLEVSSHVWISGSFCGSSNLAAEGGEALLLSYKWFSVTPSSSVCSEPSRINFSASREPHDLSRQTMILSEHPMPLA